MFEKRTCLKQSETRFGRNVIQLKQIVAAPSFFFVSNPVMAMDLLSGSLLFRRQVVEEGNDRQLQL